MHQQAEPADRGDASASVDGDGSGPESSDAGTRRRRGPIFFIALGVAVVLALVFWPDGAAVLFGLAIFHLIDLVFTGIPLLREVRKELNEQIEETA